MSDEGCSKAHLGTHCFAVFEKGAKEHCSSSGFVSNETFGLAYPPPKDATPSHQPSI